MGGIKFLIESLNHPAIWVGAAFIVLWVMTWSTFVEPWLMRRKKEENGNDT